MPISHTVWSLDEKKPLEVASLIDEKELELLLRDNIEILNKGWLVISNQVKTDAGILTETRAVLAIIVPYEFHGRENVTVYRYHDSAEKLSRLDSKPVGDYVDGTFYLDTVNGLIYIYANLFSTYAIGYTQCYNISGPIRFGLYTGDVTVSLLDSENAEKYVTTATLSNGSGTYSFTHVLKGTYTLRAVWIEDGKETTIEESLSVQ